MSGTRPSWESEFKDSLNGRRVLITGSRGFIGAHLANALVRLGAVVVASARSWSGGAIDDKAQSSSTQSTAASSATDAGSASAAVSEAAASVSAPAASIPVECDLCDFAATRKMLWASQPEIIFHLAATVTARESLDLVEPTLNNIVVASVNLMTAAAESRCKQFVCCATSEQPTDNDSPPASPYAAAKQCVSTYARLFRSQFALPAQEVMPFLTFGPGQDEKKLIPHIITSLLSGKAPNLSDANRSFDLVYIDDVVRGMIMTATHPTGSDQPVELGSGTAITMKEIVERIAGLMETDIRANFGSSDKRTSYSGRVADLKRSREVTGWQPIWNLEEALQETIGWYRQRCNDG